MKPPGRKRAHSLQGFEILPQITALAGSNDNRPAETHKITTVHLAGCVVEEAEMIGRVSGRGNNPQFDIARTYSRQRGAESDDVDRGPLRHEGIETARVIGVTMCD